MDQWMRWFPTCLGEPRRTEASWRAPKRRGSCCGRSWNADLPLGSFSTDRYTEKKKKGEETKRRVSPSWVFFVFCFAFFPFSRLTAAVTVCSVSPICTAFPGYIFPVLLCSALLADRLFSQVALFCLLQSFHHCFCPYSSLLLLPTSNPHPYFCVVFFSFPYPSLQP